MCPPYSANVTKSCSANIHTLRLHRVMYTHIHYHLSHRFAVNGRQLLLHLCTAGIQNHSSAGTAFCYSEHISVSEDPVLGDGTGIAQSV